jgi:hypothetical protein
MQLRYNTKKTTYFANINLGITYYDTKANYSS